MGARLRLLAGTLAITATLAAAGCGSDDGGTTADPQGGGAPTATAGAKVGESVTVGASFWHAGWKVDLGTASTKAVTNGRGVVAAIEATFNNLGTEASQFESRLILSSGGNDYESSPLDSQIPSVPGGAKQTGVLAFRVTDGFSLADAVLTIGNPANNQAIVPFGPGGTLVTQEPRTVPVAVSGSIKYPMYGKPGTVAIKVTGGELRADVPKGHNEVKKGNLALTLTYSITYTYGDIYSYYWMDNNLQLELPDGTTVGVDDIDSVPNVKPGTTVSDLTVRFLIKDPPSGSYNLILKNNNGATPATKIPFTMSLT